MKWNAVVAVLGFLGILSFSVLSYAADLAPGGSCDTSGQYMLSGGVENSGTGYLLVCDGSAWVKVVGFDTGGVVQPQFVNTVDCTDGDTLVYDSASGGLSCGVVDEAAPVWITPAGTIDTTDVGLAVSEIVVASDDTSTPTYTKVSGAYWLSVASNGTVSGTAPSTDGVYSLIVRASDDAGNTADRTFNVVVENATPAGPTGCNVPGDICADYTIYVGKTPDGDVDYYTTQINLPGRYAWNDGTSNWLNSSLTDCTGVVSTCRTGESNTNALVVADSATTTAGVDPHHAALACFCLGEEHADAPNATVPSECSGNPQGTNSRYAHGYDDWYLPSLAEMDVMFVNLVSPGDPDNPTYQDGANTWDGGAGAANDGSVAGSFDDYYWTSSEDANSSYAWLFNTDNGQYRGNINVKNRNANVRCVRK